MIIGFLPQHHMIQGSKGQKFHACIGISDFGTRKTRAAQLFFNKKTTRAASVLAAHCTWNVRAAYQSRGQKYF